MENHCGSGISSLLITVQFKLICQRDVRMGMPNARKTDGTNGSELRNTLEGTEHGKGVEVWNEVRKQGGDMEHIT